jgi:hypothetical protein
LERFFRGTKNNSLTSFFGGELNMNDDLHNNDIPQTKNNAADNAIALNAIACIPRSDDASFYLKALGDSYKPNFDSASGVRSLDAEIVMLRVAISTLIEHNFGDLKSVRLLVLALERVVRTRYQPERNDEEGLAERMATILGNIHLPPGISPASLQK